MPTDDEYEGLSPFERYRKDCHESGEEPCVDTAHHKWVVSDEDENACYCEKCGCCEY